jgi:protein NRD1
MLESIEDYQNTLNEINNLKPPGVSGSRIKNLKEFFLSHVDEEDNLVRILINCCKTVPVSNKLGPLYVVDSIVRSLIEEIGSNSDVEINSESPNGTAAAAIYKFQTNIEDLLNDAIPNSNDDVKDRISKLIDIWLNCSTFKREILQSIKDKYYKSFTPPGTPPKKKVSFAAEPTSINENNSKTSSNINKDPTSVLQALANLAKNTPSPNSNVNANTKLASPTQNVSNATLSPPSSNSGANADNTNSSNPNAIFQLLQNMNKMTNNNDTNNGNDNYRDRSDRGRGNNNNDYNRRRDRSPDRNHHGNNNDFNDPKPTHVEGEQNVPSNPHYRIKKAFVDPTIPQGCINVSSRTIFIGGVPPSMNEHQLVQTLKPYAEVQSVIINTARKHAFVKVYSRNEADQVIQAFSVSHPSGLRARWGVGFGPRDCCNYQTGVSTIPIQRLTDADKKWIVSAQWGGSTPDLPLQPGLFVEEPDIEVGHGVSSKSISRKMPTNSSQNGPKSDGRFNGNNNTGGGNNNNRFNPNNMPINYNNNPMHGGPMSNQPYPNMMPYQQGPPQGMMTPQQQQPLPYQQNTGYPIPNVPPQGMMGSPGQMPGQFNIGGGNSGQPPMDQAQMMAAMMSAMSQMQQGQGQGQGQVPPSNQPGQPPVDMNAMMQVMASMMGQNQSQQPPSSH